jgi:F0F1-type ATP synthase membrane subunit a
VWDIGRKIGRSGRKLNLNGSVTQSVFDFNFPPRFFLQNHRWQYFLQKQVVHLLLFITFIFTFLTIYNAKAVPNKLQVFIQQVYNQSSTIRGNNDRIADNFSQKLLIFHTNYAIDL